MTLHISCHSILVCCEALERSPYKRFWLEDSAEIMKSISEEEKQDQLKAETALFRTVLTRLGDLAVPEEIAFDAVRALICTVYQRRALKENYESILCWMAQGVCSHIFK